MSETPETHKEIIEIKREVREIRQTQDAEIHHSRQKWENFLFGLLEQNIDMMRVLLAIDGTKSAKELEKECGLYQKKCWRLLDKLQKEGIIFRLEETKKGSPIYSKSRWYIVLRLDENVEKRLMSHATQTESKQMTLEPNNVKQGNEP